MKLITLRRAPSIKPGREYILYNIETLLDPLILVSTLWGTVCWIEGSVSSPVLLLAIIVFSLSFPGNSYINTSTWYLVSRIVMGWLITVALLVAFGSASRYILAFDREVLVTWFWLAPANLVAAHLLLRQATPAIQRLQGGRRLAVIAGMNEQGLELARTIKANPFLGVDLAGFLDDRIHQRLNPQPEFGVLGRLSEIAQFVKQNGVNVVYLSLPMASQPRVLDILGQLRDTTASIYFVPDTFVTDLIQGRPDVVGNVPVVAVCETPFRGGNGLLKRLSDIVFATLILVVIAPVLLLIALTIKLTSPGPVIFKQRRYGLDGREIVVYKFRSMTVCEDGPQISTVTRNDPRVTTIGALLRKTSLDELPQFINVLQNRMSIVGPRPHAIAHNEQYSKIIKGYMLRHKVKPGITGWAQINGYRGDTDTLDKMKKRVEFDLDYLRHWSLKLDLSIMIKTALLIFGDKNAY